MEMIRDTLTGLLWLNIKDDKIQLNGTLTDLGLLILFVELGT